VTSILVGCSSSGSDINTNSAETSKQIPLDIVVLGDSLGASYGVPSGEGWVDLMRAEFEGYVPDLDVINTSISGDTVEGGLARLPSIMDSSSPDLLILQLGVTMGLGGARLKI